MPGIEHVLHARLHPGPAAPGQITLLRQFNGELTPVRGEVAVAVHSHGREFAAVIVRIHLQREPHAVKLDVDLDDFGFLLGAPQGGQQQAGENCNDGDDDEQLNQAKGCWPNPTGSGMRRA